MKIGLLFTNIGEFVQPGGVAALARTAEACGIESLWTVEHVAVPVGYTSTYPYARSGRMPGSEDLPIPDPLLWLGYAAAVTSTIRLATGILILPQRHPVYVAKQLATLDLLSRGRVIAGIGIGWLEEEFRALGIPFRERAGRTEESVQAIRTLWQPGPRSFAGRYYRFEHLESNPKPVQADGVPFVVGGHVEGAARRAARIGDGFFPARGEPRELRALFDAVRDECERRGRDPGEVELTAGGRVRTPDDLEPYRRLGVTRVVVNTPARDVDGMRRGLETLKANVLDRL